MGNAGLAERGDARIYFGRAVDDDPAEFARLTGLAKDAGAQGRPRPPGRGRPRLHGAPRALDEGPGRPISRELARFIGVHMKAAGCAAGGLLRSRRGGPRGLGRAASRTRLGEPAGRRPPGARARSSMCRPDTPTLGMCGILRPVTKLAPVGPAVAGPMRK
ncbi:MAG: hypothetical protein M0C28_42155 [Candidatus Moduliflexus flocculans]|nr:hypothetical protein [Candidatus Moduliflexus flocculans]